MLLEVEDGRRESRIRRAAQEDFSKMFQAACAAGGNHRDADRARNRRRQLAIEAGLRAVRIHGREEDLSGAERRDAARPLDGFQSGLARAAVSQHFPPRRLTEGACGFVVYRVSVQSLPCAERSGSMRVRTF